MVLAFVWPIEAHLAVSQLCQSFLQVSLRPSCLVPTVSKIKCPVQGPTLGGRNSDGTPGGCVFGSAETLRSCHCWCFLERFCDFLEAEAFSECKCSFGCTRMYAFLNLFASRSL